jgi:hypothetical protein
MACSVIRQVAADLDVGPLSETSSAATRNQIESLISALLDERAAREGIRNALLAERMIILEGTPSAASATAGPAVSAAIAPAFQLQAIHIAEGYSIAAIASQRADWPTSRAMLPPSPVTKGSHLETMLQLRDFMAWGNGERPLLVHYRTLAGRRIAACFLALRLYAADHGGALPESITDLAPKYLPAIPADPFFTGGSPIGYLPHRDPPALFSAGYSAYFEWKPARSSKTENH